MAGPPPPSAAMIEAMSNAAHAAPALRGRGCVRACRRNARGKRMPAGQREAAPRAHRAPCEAPRGHSFRGQAGARGRPREGPGGGRVAACGGARRPRAGARLASAASMEGRAVGSDPAPPGRPPARRPSVAWRPCAGIAGRAGGEAAAMTPPLWSQAGAARARDPIDRVYRAAAVAAVASPMRPARHSLPSTAARGPPVDGGSRPTLHFSPTRRKKSHDFAFCGDFFAKIQFVPPPP